MDDMEMEPGQELDAPATTGFEEPAEDERKLVRKLQNRILDDKKAHAKAFKRMRRDMKIARTGRTDDWPEDWYVANITGRHINQKVAALYAKNPKAIARRRERLDFKVWDESEASLTMAIQVMQMAQPAMQIAQQAEAAAPAAQMGDPMAQQMMMSPEVQQAQATMQDPQVQNAMAIVEDYQAGMQAREMADRIGKTLELLFSYFTQEQTPVDFKTSMKQVVRRALTTGVAYVKLGFQREFDQDPQVSQRLADFTSQLRHIERLTQEATDPEGAEDQDVVRRELQESIKSLQEQEYVLMREGLIFDFPESTAVIPDRLCRSLPGFVGARWLTVEYPYTPDEVKEDFGVDLRTPHTYSRDGHRDPDQSEFDLDDEGEQDKDCEPSVRVWEHYDRHAGVVYYICDGHPAFLRPPAAPDIYVEDFWPVFPLTFNEVEEEGGDGLFPPSDVTLMYSQQEEYNSARQGQREHRKAARPRFAARKGALSDEEKMNIAMLEPFEVTEINLQEGERIENIIGAIPMPGVDPNLYETGGTMTDVQLVVGSQEAQFGAVSKATATESSIAEGSRVASVDSNDDDLTSFLTRIARSAGQVLLREMSPEMVLEIAGPGAVWPEASLEETAKELYLEVEAGSTGKPNQAQEIRNWKEMLPFLIQMPNISPMWLARQSIKRLDDRMDLTDALSENIPAIVAMNRTMGAAPAPGAAPEDQGGAGAENEPAPPGGPTGTPAAMGNNQV